MIELSEARKNCTTCGVEKPISQFYKHKQCRYGVNSVCKECDVKESKAWREKNKHLIPIQKRAYLMKSRYGTTVESYELMFQRQNGLCKICGAIATKRLDVDHCHKTKKIRGLLCRSCNVALGLVDDNISTLKNMISYLEEN